MSVTAKKRRTALRTALRDDPRFTDGRLRAFVDAEIPSLTGDDEWTPKQRTAIARLYAHHLQDGRWTCECCWWRPVERFGDLCGKCEMDHKGQIAPIDWEYLGC